MWLAGSMTDDGERHRLIDLLDELDAAATENVARGNLIRVRLRELREALAAGESVSDAIAHESEPRAVEMISANMAMLEDAGSRYRAGLALALRKDGITIEAIGELFGVSRQRISALLMQKAAASEDDRANT